MLGQTHSNGLALILSLWRRYVGLKNCNIAFCNLQILDSPIVYFPPTSARIYNALMYDLCRCASEDVLVYDRLLDHPSINIHHDILVKHLRAIMTVRLHDASSCVCTNLPTVAPTNKLWSMQNEISAHCNWWICTSTSAYYQSTSNSRNIWYSQFFYLIMCASIISFKKKVFKCTKSHFSSYLLRCQLFSWHSRGGCMKSFVEIGNCGLPENLLTAVVIRRVASIWHVHTWIILAYCIISMEFWYKMSKPHPAVYATYTECAAD